MRILVLSDSHRHIDTGKSVISKLRKDIDYAIHLGDNDYDMAMIMENINIPYVTVAGNCDFTDESPSNRLMTFQGVNIFICHGHQYSVKSTLTKVYHKGLSENAKVVLFGHSHHPVNTIENGIHLVNPGSISFPRGVEYASYAVVTIENGLIDTKIVAVRDNGLLKPFTRFNMEQ